MQEEDLKIESKKTDPRMALIVSEIICVTVLILAVVVMKLMFKPTYQNVKKWYTDHFRTETSISEVLGDTSGGSDEN